MAEAHKNGPLLGLFEAIENIAHSTPGQVPDRMARGRLKSYTTLPLGLHTCCCLLPRRFRAHVVVEQTIRECHTVHDVPKERLPPENCSRCKTLRTSASEARNKDANVADFPSSRRIKSRQQKRVSEGQKRQWGTTKRGGGKFSIDDRSVPGEFCSPEEGNVCSRGEFQ